jgi:hypothetical protein
MFVVDGIDGEHVLEVDEEVAHDFGPTVPPHAFVDFEWVDEQLGYLALAQVYQEGNSELLGIFDAFRLEDVL